MLRFESASCVKVSASMADRLRGLANVERALAELEGYAALPIANRRDKAGLIQGFEFTFELFWKLFVKLAPSAGIEAKSPREALMAGAQLRLIEPAEQSHWTQMLLDRTQTSHTYNADLAEEIVGRVSRRVPAVFPLDPGKGPCRRPPVSSVATPPLRHSPHPAARAATGAWLRSAPDVGRRRAGYCLGGYGPLRVAKRAWGRTSFARPVPDETIPRPRPPHVGREWSRLGHTMPSIDDPPGSR